MRPCEAWRRAVEGHEPSFLRYVAAASRFYQAGGGAVRAARVSGLRLSSGRPWGRPSGAQVLARAAQSPSAGRGPGGASGGRVGEGSVRSLAAPVRSGGGARRVEESGGTLGAPSGAGGGGARGRE